MAAITSYKGEALLKEASLFLEVYSFMPYINSIEKNLLFIKSLYYTKSRPRSPELAIKYLEKETEYSCNTKRALGTIKSTLSANNIDRPLLKLLLSSAIYLKELDYKLLKPFIAILLFKGLSSSFNAFSSRKYKEVTKNIKNIDITKLISDIISKEARLKSNTISLANKTTSNKNPLYKHYSKRDYIEPKC
ncbi:hypothetical protein LCER1_G008631 [Lachnellula cervina]|uniref:Uncharacterized protein n=1 Tax=Lachnellula cervina TaxID=1316786 RepID=A0A7D8YQ99_9HELO|nr:hypothetical protein LCER1_G008631 [Lachnellula cervina]